MDVLEELKKVFDAENDFELISNIDNAVRSASKNYKEDSFGRKFFSDIHEKLCDLRYNILI
jgi:hypothetical protein